MALGAIGRITAAVLAAVAIVALFPTVAVATPPEGIVSATVFARASFADPTDLSQSGTMSFYDSEDPTCTARIYSAGQAFVVRGQGHVHIARNEGNVDLELWATYFDVPPRGAFRIDAPDPGNCSF